MGTYLLDSDVAIALINGHEEWIDLLIGQANAISSVTAYELAVGIEKCRSKKTIRETRDFLSAIEVIDFDVEAAFESARVRAELESVGQGIGPYDTLIAGHCRLLGRSLVTNNLREFERVSNLEVVSIRK